MNDLLLKSALVLLAFLGSLLFAWSMNKLVVRSERKEWKKKFDAIHRGDKFIQWLDNDNPFKRQYGQVVEITGKSSVCDKRFYLEYKIGEDSVAIYDSCCIQGFFDLYHYIPYTYQDK